MAKAAQAPEPQPIVSLLIFSIIIIKPLHHLGALGHSQAAAIQLLVFYSVLPIQLHIHRLIIDVRLLWRDESFQLRLKASSLTEDGSASKC